MRKLILVALIVAFSAPNALAFDFFGFGSSSRKVTHVPPAKDGFPAMLDAAEAVAMISGFRKSKGLPPVTINAQLTAIAAKHAKLMAKRDKLAHVLFGEGGFAQRIAAGGYDAAVATENVGAGYHTLQQAIDGWKASPDHRANMLNRDVTEIGIAVAYTGQGKFHDYWSLVLAKKSERRQEGLYAGPVTGDGSDTVTLGGATIGGAAQ